MQIMIKKIFMRFSIIIIIIIVITNNNNDNINKLYLIISVLKFKNKYIFNEKKNAALTYK